jgi:hypothetical protein
MAGTGWHYPEPALAGAMLSWCHGHNRQAKYKLKKKHGDLHHVSFSDAISKGELKARQEAEKKVRSDELKHDGNT